MSHIDQSYWQNRAMQLEDELRKETARADAAVELRKADLLFWQKQCELRETALKAAEELHVYLYNSGYMAGHNDTVEGCFTDIHQSDMKTYHADVVKDILEEMNE